MQALGVLKQWLSRLGTRQGKLALGGLLAAILAVLLAVLTRGDNAQAIASTLRNPLSIFASRSPGVRLSGALYQTKPRVAPAVRARPVSPIPRERVLSVGRTRPAPALSFGPGEPDLALLGRPDPILSVPAIGTPDFAPVGFEVPGFGFGDTPGFTGNPAPPTDGNPSPPGGGGGPGSNTPGSAVPEPATWLLMILGVGMIGRALRSQRACGPASDHLSSVNI
jgi:hypothetical protein